MNTIKARMSGISFSLGGGKKPAGGAKLGFSLKGKTKPVKANALFAQEEDDDKEDDGANALRLEPQL